MIANPAPTPYPEINLLLRELLRQARAVLGGQFTGMYLYGSLACGDFNLDRSDIDFLVATRDEIAGARLSALQAMHRRIASAGSRWALELEGSYISLAALRRYNRRQAMHPHIDRGSGELQVLGHDSDWVVQRYVLRSSGVTLAGPDPRSLIDPISVEELQQAIVEVVQGWWASMLADPRPLEFSGYRSYAVMTMCRVLYTLEEGRIASKPVASRWAQARLGQPWPALIERALAYPQDNQDGTLADTLAFIRFTVARCREWNKMRK